MKLEVVIDEGFMSISITKEEILKAYEDNKAQCFCDLNTAMDMIGSYVCVECSFSTEEFENFITFLKESDYKEIALVETEDGEVQLSATDDGRMYTMIPFEEACGFDEDDEFDEDDDSFEVLEKEDVLSGIEEFLVDFGTKAGDTFIFAFDNASVSVRVKENHKLEAKFYKIEQILLPYRINFDNFQ